MKNFITENDLNMIGAVCVGMTCNGFWVNTDRKTVMGPSTEEMMKPGFYFLVNSTNIAVARFYVGRQRSKSGFNNVLAGIRAQRTTLGAIISNNGKVYRVFYVPVNKMKPLTTGYGKGQIAMVFTKSHNDAFQNLEEMNRMLNDNFSFKLQKY